jgi:Flp pilus assembly pilin Flp
LRLSRRAQSIIEYVVVLGLVASALIAMQVYVKRGVQAKVKDMTDTMLPSGAVDAGLKQLTNVNPVIPLLNEGTSVSSASTTDAKNRVAIQGGSLAYESSAKSHSEMKMGQHNPSKEINVQGE